MAGACPRVADPPALLKTVPDPQGPINEGLVVEGGGFGHEVFSFTLTRSVGQSLGVALRPGTEESLLEVTDVNVGGPIEERNKRIPSSRFHVLPGDVIFGVNGEEDDVDEMIQLIKGHPTLRLKVCQGNPRLPQPLTPGPLVRVNTAPGACRYASNGVQLFTISSSDGDVGDR